MRHSVLVLRPHRSGYVFGGVVLGLAGIIWVIVQAVGSIRSATDAILAWFVFAIVGLYGISELISTALTKTMVDGDTVQVSGRLGRHRRFARADVSHAARRSIYAPRRYGGDRTNAFLLVGKNGRCLVRLPEDDYGDEALKSLVETLGLKWPHTQSATVRQINREFPGAYAFDYQRITIAILIILASALAVVILAFWFR